MPQTAWTHALNDLRAGKADALSNEAAEVLAVEIYKAVIGKLEGKRLSGHGLPTADDLASERITAVIEHLDLFQRITPLNERLKLNQNMTAERLKLAQRIAALIERLKLPEWVNSRGTTIRWLASGAFRKFKKYKSGRAHNVIPCGPSGLEQPTLDVGRPGAGNVSFHEESADVAECFQLALADMGMVEKPVAVDVFKESVADPAASWVELARRFEIASDNTAHRYVDFGAVSVGRRLNYSVEWMAKNLRREAAEIVGWLRKLDKAAPMPTASQGRDE